MTVPDDIPETWDEEFGRLTAEIDNQDWLFDHYDGNERD